MTPSRRYMVGPYGNPTGCIGCALPLSTVKRLWTAPGGRIVCADCYLTITGHYPESLEEVNARRGKEKRSAK